MIVTAVACHNCEFIITASPLPFVVVLSGTTTRFALKLHCQLLLVVDVESGTGKLGINAKFGWSEQVGVMVWSCLTGNGHDRSVLQACVSYRAS